jgi:hypothetical protein
VKRLAVAGLSARALAEQAAREGFEVVALDLFGDRDTLSAASRWLPIGDATVSLRIDGPRLLDALDTVVADDGVEGWVPGGGFDGRADLLEQAATRLPLLGNDAATVRRVRDPRDFFATLAVHGVVHPEVRHEGPVPAQDWLLKDAGDSGGRHVRGADTGLSAALPGALHYLQRAQAGTPGRRRSAHLPRRRRPLALRPAAAAPGRRGAAHDGAGVRPARPVQPGLHL